MFYLVSYIFGWILIIIGLIGIFSGIIGLFRFPDFFTKLHAGGVIDSFGMPACLLGLSFLQTNFLSSFKLILACILLFILSPTITHALVNMGLKNKLIKDKNVADLEAKDV